MRLKITILMLCFGFTVMAQNQLNEYKYIIVPKKLSSFKTENKHQTSTLLKFLFQKKGFNVTYDDALPDDLAKDRCLGLMVDLEDGSSLFSTKTTLVLKDCELKEVFRTHQGRSKKKEYKLSYKEAINDAFSSFDAIAYSYSPKKEDAPTGNLQSQETLIVSFKNDVHHMDVQDSQEKIVEQVATPEEQRFKETKPVTSTIVKKEVAPVKTEEAVKELLYAQPIENGFQLVDSTPKIRYKLLKTAVNDIFLVSGSGVGNGLVYKKDGKWFLEYAKVDGSKALEELNIKF